MNIKKKDEVLNKMIQGKDLLQRDDELTENICQHIMRNNELTLVGTLNFVRFQSVLCSDSIYHRICEQSDKAVFELDDI